MPFTTRMKSTDGQTESVSVDHIVEQALVFGVLIAISTVYGYHARTGVMVHPDKTVAFGKTLLPGSESLFDDKIFVWRSIISAAARRASPCIKDQKPFGVSGNNQGEQRNYSNEGLHGEHPYA